MSNPTPPAGMRWREVAFSDGIMRRLREGKNFEWKNKEWIYCHTIAIADMALYRDLELNPIEPIPTPAVDRSTERWRSVRNIVRDVHLGSIDEDNRDRIIVNDEATDRIVALFTTPVVDPSATAQPITEAQAIAALVAAGWELYPTAGTRAALVAPAPQEVDRD